MSDTIAVKIYATQTVQYSQTVHMLVADFEEYEAMCRHSANDRAFAALAEKYLDLDEVWDADEFKDVEITSLAAPHSPQERGGPSHD